MKMPGHCCALGCKSNYDSSLKVEGSITMFNIPSNEERRQVWIKAIARNNWAPSKRSGLCAKHFEDKYIIKTYRKQLEDGSVIDAPCRWILTKDAVPTIFAKELEEQRQKALERDLKANEFFFEDDLIKTYDEFISNFKYKCDDWLYQTNENMCYLYQINFSTISGVSVTSSIIVNCDLNIKVFKKDNTEISSQDLQWILPTGKLTLWSQFERLLAEYRINEVLSEHSYYKKVKTEIEDD